MRARKPTRRARPASRGTFGVERNVSVQQRQTSQPRVPACKSCRALTRGGEPSRSSIASTAAVAAAAVVKYGMPVSSVARRIENDSFIDCGVPTVLITAAI